jgi:hypothetical protein
MLGLNSRLEVHMARTHSFGCFRPFFPSSGFPSARLSPSDPIYPSVDPSVPCVYLDLRHVGGGGGGGCGDHFVLWTTGGRRCAGDGMRRGRQLAPASDSRSEGPVRVHLLCFCSGQRCYFRLSYLSSFFSFFLYFFLRNPPISACTFVLLRNPRVVIVAVHIPHVHAKGTTYNRITNSW